MWDLGTVPELGLVLLNDKQMEYHIVKYSGPFGFIKPWTAVRDGETFSQQFLTPSIVEGMEKKLFPELLSERGIKRIMRHRLSYNQMDAQQEVTQTRGWNYKKDSAERPRSILTRQVLLNPVLFLAFETFSDALQATNQHLCLCRNEDLVFPDGPVQTVSEEEFDTDDDTWAGFELMFGRENPNAFLVGYNRYADAAPMYGSLKTYGQPVYEF